VTFGCDIRVGKSMSGDVESIRARALTRKGYNEATVVVDIPEAVIFP
jgi:hypothetical protein